MAFQLLEHKSLLPSTLKDPSGSVLTTKASGSQTFSMTQLGKRKSVLSESPSQPGLHHARLTPHFPQVLQYAKLHSNAVAVSTTPILKADVQQPMDRPSGPMQFGLTRFCYSLGHFLPWAFFFVCCFLDRVSPCSLCWPQIYSDPPASAS